MSAELRDEIVGTLIETNGSHSYILIANALIAGPLAELIRQARIGAWVEEHEFTPGQMSDIHTFIYRTAALAAAPVPQEQQ